MGQAYKLVGSSETHTVYAGELKGIDTALQNPPHNEDTREATIYTDNQAAIRAIHQPGRSSGQYILRRIWVLEHEGVPGNEKADQLAKRAAVEATWRTREITRIARINAPNQAMPHAARISYVPNQSTILVAVCHQRLREGFVNRWKD
ncbi:hypothetical protein TSTA_008290 [Talaromyces stipitatus ATCC 10500]|uniref:Uncharacterized protein n=1 Tax=Talaromyces stipitatus (strain ATCC 10500 / CBS 375.48 / QM 6759 / NRRL 1006) TaxID=441959 RepID=B8MV77_TALSN|nr:uncharacterized protein TSTA_008290 [Talaromyces stipitatus ATCC 10500]EED11533.1 hypothetical protein TSTA_008290 [Talaromyces stipitatus ATCC 10500]